MDLVGPLTDVPIIAGANASDPQASDIAPWRCGQPNCGQLFYRKEHLSRHFGRHTEGSPHVCRFCSRGFGRKDALKRHVKKHELGLKVQARACIACDRCRELKAKCDDGIPCTRCHENKSDCVRSRGGKKIPHDFNNVSRSLVGEIQSRAIIAPNVVNDYPRRENASVENVGHVEWTDPGSITSPCASQVLDLLQDGSFPDLKRSLAIGQTKEHALWEPGPPWCNVLELPPDVLQTTISEQTNTTNGQSYGYGTEDILPLSAGSEFCESPRPQPQIQDYEPVMNDDTISRSLPSWASQQLEKYYDTPGISFNEISLNAIYKDRFIDLYFARFHDQWPILHRATFLPDEVPDELTYSIVMIGAWVDGSESSRNLSLKLHDQLMAFFHTQLYDIQKYQRTQHEIKKAEWPTTIYQGVLLNLVFSMYHGGKARLSRAYMMNLMLVSTLRETGAFRESFMKSHYNPQDSEWARWIKRESIKRLALAAYQTDCCISMLMNQPPTARYQELNLSLACHDVTWVQTYCERNNVTGATEQPTERTEKQFSVIMRDALSARRRDLLPRLVEKDYYLGIHALQSALWENSQTQQVCVKESSASCDFPVIDLTWSEPDICNEIESSEQHLEYWRTDMERDILSSSAEASSQFLSQRIIILNAMMLYHLSKMGLHTNLSTMEHSIGETSPNPPPYLFHQLADWSWSRHARISLWHAAQICRLYITAKPTGNSSCVLHPVSLNALFKAGLLAWAYCCGQQQCYKCARSDLGLEEHGSSDLPLDLINEPESLNLGSWFDRGGAATFEDVVICACSVGQIVRKFEQPLLSEGANWPLADRFGTYLSSLKYIS
ncbi:hypothetical protein PEBR_07250 [Penicillium brasilianum]|uniref:C2H2 type zinc finger domain protein n=1 Tax=Penicillium brasilianum TaxID=104259 RepID=A0A1S9RW52_PENBI|nr:hypothetical protein PEBR_07250 [Penicillium brasilianum]